MEIFIITIFEISLFFIFGWFLKFIDEIFLDNTISYTFSKVIDYIKKTLKK